MRNSPILDALFPDVRTKILTATLGQAEKTWYLSELADFLHTRPSSLQREVEALAGAGILEQRREGRRLYFKADTKSPIFEELKTLFDKTAGIVPLLQQELEPFGERIPLPWFMAPLRALKRARAAISISW